MDNTYWHLIALSGRTAEALSQRADDLLVWLESKQGAASLREVAHTLLVGRAHFAHRLAIVASTGQGLQAALRQVRAGGTSADALSGVLRWQNQQHAEGTGDVAPAIWEDARQGGLRGARAVAQAYVTGEGIDWAELFKPDRPRKVRLPTYPFAEESCWLAEATHGSLEAMPGGAAVVSCAQPVRPAIQAIQAKLATFVPTWEAAVPDEHAMALAEPYASVLILARNESDAAAWRRALQEAGVISPETGAATVSAWPGASYVQHDAGRASLDPSDPGQIARLLQCMPVSQDGPRLIVQAWSLAADAPRALAMDATFHLLEALACERSRARSIVMQAWSLDEASPNPYAGAHAAIGRSIGIALPRVRFVSVALAPEVAAEVELAGAQLAQEALVQLRAQDTEVRRSVQGQRWLKRYAPWRPAGQRDGTPVPYDGVYLITGGTGGLGRLFATHLLSRGRAKVALVSRRGKAADDLAWMKRACAEGGDIDVFAADVSDRAAMQAVLAEVRRRWGPLDGVLHAAGVAAPQEATGRTAAQVDAIFQPKLAGTELLDELTRPDPLRFFTVFSSLASVLGEFGVGHYAVANRFLDAFAARREAQRRRGERAGITRSIDWPLWRDGGMGMNEAATQVYLASMKMALLETGDGLAVFDQILDGQAPQVVVCFGEEASVTAALNGASTRPADARETGQEPLATEEGVQIETDLALALSGALPSDLTLAERLLLDLQQAVARLLKLPLAKIDPDENLGNLGFDSISFKHLMLDLCDRLGEEVPPAILFGHSTLSGLSKHLSEQYEAKLTAYYAARNTASSSSSAPSPQAPAAGLPGPLPASAPNANAESDAQAVAIIGAGGLFPGSPDLASFWRHLEDGTELVSEVPASRWDWREHYGDPQWEKNKCLANQGAFIDDPAQFDAAFFKISPHEAQLMDPQQRLLLQTTWHALEDAACAPSTLAGEAVGVFVGVQFPDYQHLLADMGEIHPHMATGNANSIIANRLSYFFNFMGPSETVDTACSSSLVAVHRALRALRSQECSMAVVAGANLVLSPQTMVATGVLGVLSKDGRCKTFDRRADGYVKGEGVSAVILKRLDHAIRDGDPIRAVIRGSAVNHGGRASSLTAPNPVAQTAVVRQALRDAGVSAASISYVEAHGTGTELGDPIEFEALKAAFLPEARPASASDAIEPWCGLGTVKTNIGHLEPAAGMAGLCKVMLSLEHRRLPALKNFETLNPYIKLEGSPFRLVTTAQDWVVPGEASLGGQPLRAGLSSFGFGGTNAHVVVEQWLARSAGDAHEAQDPGPDLFVLSAKSEESLRGYAERVCQALDEGDHRLRDVCRTFREGRDAMPLRVAMLVDSMAALKQALRDHLAGKPNPCVVPPFANEGGSDADAPRVSRPASLAQALAREGRWRDLAALWASGASWQWDQVMPSPEARRIRLPGYPFLKTRHWLEAKADRPAPSDTSPGTAHESTAEPDAPSTVLAIPAWRASPLGADLPELAGDTAVVFLQCGTNDWSGAFDQAASRLTNAAAMHLRVGDGLACDARAVARELALRQPARVHIVHASDTFFKGQFNDVSQACGTAVWPLFELVRAIEGATQATIAVIACDRSEGGHPPTVALQGLFKSYATESRRVSGRVVSLDAHALDEAGAVLAAELADGTTREHVRYQAGVRQIEYLAERKRPIDTGSASPYADGVFLVSGGLGGIGRMLSKALLAAGARAVCVAGRKQPEEVSTDVGADGAFAGVLDYRRVDIADGGQVHAWVDEMRAAYGRIDGVFHLAGVLRDGLAVHKTREDFDQVLAAKAGGALNLDEATRADALRCFVMYASLSGVLGNSGQIDYGYANRFLDALAQWREQRRAEGTRSGISLSIDWPLWAEGGMRIDAAVIEAIGEMTGMAPMPGQEGTALTLALAAEPFGSEATSARVAVCHGEALRVKALLGLPVAGGATPQRASARRRPDSPRLSADMTTEDIVAALRQQLAIILGMDVQAIGLDTSIADLGMDSLLAIKLLREIEASASLRLYPSELIEHDTLRKLAQHLKHELGGTEGPRSLPTPRPAMPLQLPSAIPGASRVATDRVAQPTVFLLSTPRAGSTLMRVMLMGHPQLFAPPELHLLNHAGMRARREYMEATHQTFLGEGLLKTVAALKGCSAEEAMACVRQWEAQDWSTRDVYAWLATQAGGRRLVDKSPSYGGDLGVLQEAEQIFEQPFYIHLVRHPVAVMESFVRNRFAKMLGLKEDPWAVAEDIWTRFNHNIACFLDTVPAERQIRVQYEALVSDPEGTLRELCARLGMAFHPDMLKPYEGDKLTAGLHDESMPVGDPNFLHHADIRPELAETWRDRLSRPVPLTGQTSALARTLGYVVEAQSAFELAPAQAAFMRQYPLDPSWYILAHGDMAATHAMARGDVDAALAQLMARHEALGLRFEASESGWRQAVCQEPACLVDWMEVDALPTPDDMRARLIHAGLDLAHAPLMRCAVAAAGQRRRICLLVHHLIADGVSVQILLRDLVDALGGKTLAPIKAGASWRDYIAITQRLAQDEAGLNADFWRGQSAGKPTRLPLEIEGGANLMRHERTFRLQIDTRAWQAQLDGRESLFWFLVAGLSASVGQWSGMADPLIAHRLHRRRPAEGAVFESTVGWFAGDVPLRLASGERAVTEVLAVAKALFAGVPAGGTSYEMLALAGVLPPAHELCPLRFNYQPVVGMPTGMDCVDHELWEPPAHERPYLIDWVAKDLGDELAVRVRYADTCWSPDAIATRVAHWQESVTELIGQWAAQHPKPFA